MKTKVIKNWTKKLKVQMIKENQLTQIKGGIEKARITRDMVG